MLHILLLQSSPSLRSLDEWKLSLADVLVVGVPLARLLASVDVLPIHEDFEVKNVAPLLVEPHLGDLEHQFILACQDHFGEVSDWHAVIDLVPVLLVEHNA